MATPEPDDVDWAALEADLAGADVVDLGKARAQRRPTDGFAVDIDDEHDEIGDKPVPVDLPVASRRAERRPIIPTWLRSRAEAAALARWTVGHYRHVIAYYLTRIPLYAGRLFVRSPRGLVRSVAATSRWAADTEGLPVRLAAVRREDAEDYLKLSRQRDARVRLRTLVLIAGSPSPPSARRSYCSRTRGRHAG